jgi:hypothetical protein
MKAEIQPDPTFPDLQETSTKYTKPCGQASESPNQDNFVDIVDESQESEESKTMGSFKPGSTIQYRIPRLVSPRFNLQILQTRIAHFTRVF